MADDELVEVPFGEKPSETAVLLLAAAEELDLGADEVRTTTGAFIVPKKIADQAGFGEKKQPAKKAAKKTAKKE